jgi:hypothetical protein
MEAVSTSETSVNYYQTEWRNIPEDIHLQTSRRENLKLRTLYVFLVSHISYMPAQFSRLYLIILLTLQSGTFCGSNQFQ